ncbi:Chitin binding domain [Cinara cedri]|uniref:Chitin binding domain n=1 Tax=Cinara cedri TaxID=506608 RepID=A0A5E4NCC4_9HEMI|nr:Chitin binding domain [Cinara cedri]
MFFKTFVVAVLTVVCTSDAAQKQRQVYSGYSDEYAQNDHKYESRQNLNKIPGTPGVDYPIYHVVPETSFNCKDVPYAPGMYANVETGCQAYHICHDGREGHQGASFLCTNGTLFNQKEFTCDWWYNVDCSKATYYYDLNTDPTKNPFAPKPKATEEPYKQPYNNYYSTPKYYQ